MALATVKCNVLRGFQAKKPNGKFGKYEPTPKGKPTDVVKSVTELAEIKNAKPPVLQVVK